MAGEYESPPITEAVIGVEFAGVGLDLVQLTQLGDLWPDLNVINAMPALGPSVAAGQPSFELPFRFTEGVPPVRIWFASVEGDWLIQVQDARLTLNWRRRGTRYPGFEVMSERFGHYFALLSARVRDLVGIIPRVVVTEFSYFNRLDREFEPGDVYALFQPDSAGLPGTLLMTRLEQVRNLKIEDWGNPGQVGIVSQPIVDQEGEATQLVISTKFFMMPSEDEGEIGRSLDSAHRASKSTFEGFTRKDVQKSVWGRR